MSKLDDIVASTVHSCNGGDCMVREFADSLIEALKMEIRNQGYGDEDDFIGVIDLAYSKLKEESR